MDSELPHVPVRQWVLSLPHPLRYRLAYDHALCTALHRVLATALTKRLRRLARARGPARERPVFRIRQSLRNHLASAAARVAAVARKILQHLGLPAQGSAERAGARTCFG